MTNEELQRKVRAEVERRLREASTSNERIEHDPSVPFPLEMLDPNLDDEPECDCKTRGCERFACKGQCGCRCCDDAYQDFLSLE